MLNCLAIHVLHFIFRLSGVIDTVFSCALFFVVKSFCLAI